MSARGTSNSNSRGNSEDRRRRRAFLVEKYGSPSGKTIPCFHCKKPCRVDTKTRTWEVDRFPICGHAGGRYTRDNIVPACLDCNKTRCRLGCRVGGGARRVIGVATEGGIGVRHASEPPPEVVDQVKPVASVEQPPTIAEQLTPSEPSVPIEIIVAGGPLELNPKEERVLTVLTEARRSLTLSEMAPLAFPGETRANSWVRNSLRRLREHGLARKIAKGTYETAQQPLPMAHAS